MEKKEQVNHKRRRRFYEARSRDQIKKQILRLYSEGYSQNDISKILDIPRGTISRWMMEIGFKGRDAGEAGKLKSKIYHYNESIFENITDPNIAYIVGLITGDGYIVDRGKSKRLVITLAISDRQIIDDIANLLGMESLVKVRKATYSNEQDKVFPTWIL